MNDTNAMILLGMPPPMTSDPNRAIEIASEITSSPAIFSRPGEPSNKDKFDHVRGQFDNEKVLLWAVFPYAQTFVQGHPGQQQAGSFLADLRCQYLKKLVEEGLVPPLLGRVMYVRNRVWYTRFRTQLELHMTAMNPRKMNG